MGRGGVPYLHQLKPLNPNPLKKFAVVLLSAIGIGLCDNDDMQIPLSTPAGGPVVVQGGGAPRVVPWPQSHRPRPLPLHPLGSACAVTPPDARPRGSRVWIAWVAASTSTAPPFGSLAPAPPPGMLPTKRPLESVIDHPVHESLCTESCGICTLTITSCPS